MQAPCGVEIKVGQIWQEVDPRFERYIKVLKVGINARGQDAVYLENTNMDARRSWAQVKRFNGKRTGYKLVTNVE